MPDISMCQDNGCPSRVDCHRYCALPSFMQSYADFGRGDASKCVLFWQRRANDRSAADVDLIASTRFLTDTSFGG